MNIYKLKGNDRKKIATSDVCTTKFAVSARSAATANRPAGKFLKINLQDDNGGSYVAEISKAAAAELLKQLTILTMEADLA